MKKATKFLCAVLTVLLMVIMTSCGGNVPTSAENAKMKMEGLGYNVIVKNFDDEEYDTDMIAFIYATKKGTVSGSMSATLFESSAKAKSYIKDMEEDGLFYDADKTERVGRWVLEGDKEAREDFKSR